MKITDKQRLDAVAKFTKFNPFVIPRGADPRAVIDNTIQFSRRLKKATTKAAAVLALLLSAGLCVAAPVKPGAVCPLAWNPSPDANVAGYNLYSGTNSGVYTQKTFVGNVTNTALTNLFFNVTNYIAATTVDTNADGSLVESGFCLEATFNTNSPATATAPFNLRHWFK